jgi:DNA-binding transcriptional MerR regulator/methylmalonyl-CoA mutase cobalamin-binding subunit
VPDDQGLRIHEASRRLGVPAPTLRAWERRYGVPVTPRSAGGHRRYSEDALKELRLMRDEVARGRRAGDAARSVRALLSQTGAPRDFVDRLLEASTRLDPEAMRGVLDDAVAALTLNRTVDEVLMPSMRQVGQWWESGHCDVTQEHLTTEAARSWLSRVASLAPPPADEPPVLLACGPRDLHSLGVEALAVLLEHRGRRCRGLGARTPAATLVTAARATSAVAVVVVSHLSIGRRPAAEAIREVDAAGFPVFYAGNAFAFPRSRTSLPGTYLGESVSAAADLVESALTTAAS